MPLIVVAKFCLQRTSFGQQLCPYGLYLNCTDHSHWLKEMFRKCETPDMDNLDCLYCEDKLNTHVKASYQNWVFQNQKYLSKYIFLGKQTNMVQVSLKMCVEIKFFLGSVKNDNLRTLYEAVWWSFYLKN